MQASALSLRPWGARFSKVRVLIVTGCLALGSPIGAAWATACVPGHNTVITPCTFDSGVLSFNSATGPNGADLGGSGGGHHTVVSFPGAGIQISADTGFPPYSASMDGTNGVLTATITLDVSTVSGLPLIHDISLSLLDPVVTGTGTITWSLDGHSETFPNNNPIDIVLPIAVSGTTDVLSITMTEGTAGDASVEGALISYSLVPEPSALLILASGLVALLAISRWRGRLA